MDVLMRKYFIALAALEDSSQLGCAKKKYMSASVM